MDAMDRYSIRMSQPKDAADIIRLENELIAHNNVPNCSTTNSEKNIAEDMSNWFHCIVAEHHTQNNETEIVGFAVWTYGYSTRSGKVTEMKSLFVNSSHRGEGLGFALLQWIVKISLGKGVVKLGFSVNRDNQTGKEFYKKIEATNLTETEHWELMEIKKDRLIDLTKMPSKYCMND